MTKQDPSGYRDVIRAYIDVWNDGQTGRLDALLAADFVRVGDPMSESVAGREALCRLIDKMRLDMPNLTVVLEDLIMEGDRAATRWRLTGTDTGPGDFPPTGRPISVHGLSFFAFADGVLTHEWTVADSLSALQQLGFSLTPPAQDTE
jgi:steroid delta-isomerase-like uncharacterized protein